MTSTILTTPQNVPFPRSWWVEPTRILAGCYPGALDPKMADVKLKALLSAGIQGFTGEQTLTRIIQLRHFDPYLRNMLAPQTDAQHQMVLQWAKFRESSVRRKL